MKRIPNQIMLITYPDSLGANLLELRVTLDEKLAGSVGGIHILPFFPSSGDRGFSPINYSQVEPTFGDWSDVEALSRRHYLMCDMMVNHISRRSIEFQDYLARGEQSDYADMFFDYEKFFCGEPNTEELLKLYRRSDKPLFVEVDLPDGRSKKLWCSFSSEQIDLDTDSQVARDYIMSNLRNLGRHGISLVRMDAYGYITKVRGTSCFFVEPKVWDLIGELEPLLRAQDIALLPEVHDRYETALKIADHGYYTYDFVLPLLMLHTLHSGSAKEMKRWFAVAPQHQFTVLDTHDGIGVYDADGIVSSQQAENVIQRIEPFLSYTFKPMDESRKKHYKSYQLYGTYYSLLGQDDDAYLLARALQFFAPGIPQVYYVGMLAGSNDLSFPPEDHRFINRRNYTVQDLEQELERPVVRRLLSLMRLRNSHPAFAGDLEILDSSDNEIRLRRSLGGETVSLNANISCHTFELCYTMNGSLLVWA